MHAGFESSRLASAFRLAWSGDTPGPCLAWACHSQALSTDFLRRVTATFQSPA